MKSLDQIREDYKNKGFSFPNDWDFHSYSDGNFYKTTGYHFNGGYIDLVVKVENGVLIII